MVAAAVVTDKNKSESESPPKFERILFVVAMEGEAKSIIENLNLEPLIGPSFSNPFVNCYGRADGSGPTVNLVVPKKDPEHDVESIGPESAAVALSVGLNLFDPDLVVSAGTCGGIQSLDTDAAVRQGDVFIPSSITFPGRDVPISKQFQKFIKAQYKSAPLMDSEMVVDSLKQMFQKNDGKDLEFVIRTGVLGTSDSFLDNDEIGRKLGINIVDMEAAAEIRVLVNYNAHHAPKEVKFCAIKLVSDVDPDTPKAGTARENVSEEETEAKKTKRQECFMSFLKTGTAVQRLGAVSKAFVEIHGMQPERNSKSRYECTTCAAS